MDEQLVITALGDDRPGIVDELSNALFKHKLNIEDSRMSVLGGEFAVLLLVGGPEQAIDDFIADVAGLEESLNMKIMVKLTRSAAKHSTMVTYTVKVVAMDNPGIVHNLASFFSSRQINIVDLNTERYAAAHTATPMFAVNMNISVPAEIPLNQLREEFINMCDELNLDASMSSLDSGGGLTND
ncbi:MAG: glycine cleavage system protein R [Gammaproteobacteria bacterium]|nr:glycine cleavage system protein R [Gammaproteobacteria bacterium]